MPQNTFFFIPDISGFTKFINETEISHSSHIIRELLELIVDSNAMNLTVSEFEGDAVFFFRDGVAPDIYEVAEQARKMFVKFHTHLKKYEINRICQCGACKTASQLSLKFISHFGEASAYSIKDHSKLIGKDVILVHRLLKNSIPVNEYLLVTKNLGENSKNKSETHRWLDFKNGEDSYDEIGTVKYRFSPLSPLLAEIETEPPGDYSVKNSVKLIEDNIIINAPINDIYAILIDVEKKTQWVPDVKKIDTENKMPNHIGSPHRCITTDQVHNFITTKAAVDGNTMEYCETDKKKIFSLCYLLERIEQIKTRCVIKLYLRDSLIHKIIFNLFMKKRMMAYGKKCKENLKDLCEKEFSQKQIVIDALDL